MFSNKLWAKRPFHSFVSLNKKTVIAASTNGNNSCMVGSDHAGSVNQNYTNGGSVVATGVANTSASIGTPTHQISKLSLLNVTKYRTKGLINDSIGDMLTRIRNACLAKKSSLVIPFTKMNQQIAQILEKEGFIQSYQRLGLDGQYITLRLKYRSKAIYRGKKKESCITNFKRISKPGLRIYANSREIPRILGGTGIVIVSTPEGLLTDREARLRGIGGELICSVW